ncbi:MAG: flagellar hook-length control protein FliK [Dehalobacterium sp.]
MELKLTQNTKLSEMAALKGENLNNRKAKCADKSLFTVFGDLIFALLETIPAPNREKTKSVNLEERIKAEGETDYPAGVNAAWYQQGFSGQENRSDELNANLLNTVNPLNNVDIVDQTGDKTPNFNPLQETGSANLLTEEERFLYQSGENEPENMPSLAIEDVTAVRNRGNQLGIEKHQALNPEGQIMVQEETFKISQLTEEASGSYQNVVNTLKSIPEEQELRSLSLDKKQIWNSEGQIKEVTQVSGESNEADQVDLVNPKNKVNIQLNQQPEEVNDTYQKVAQGPESTPEGQERTLLLSHENKTVIVEKEALTGKNADQQQSWNYGSQINAQGESLTNNKRGYLSALINAGDQLADNNLDLDPLKKLENIPEKQKFETLFDVSSNERNSQSVEKDAVIGENMENQAMIVKDTAGQMKGWEEPSKNLGLRWGLDKLPIQIEKLFEQVSIEKKLSSWELHLEPEKLGKLKITVNWSQGKISAEFLVETGQTAKALENYLDNLRYNLGQKNIDVASLNVTVAGQSSGGGSQGLPQPFSKKERGFVLRGDGFSLPAEENENILEGISINYLV